KDQLGKEDALKCFAIAEEAKKLIVDRIAKYNIDCDLKWGYLHAIPKLTQFDDLRVWKDEWDALGYTDTEIMSKTELEARLGTTIYHGALREGGAGHFHPLNYCLGLAKAAIAAGAQIFENSAVLDVEQGPTVTARTREGRVRAKFMIAGCNA